MSAMPLTVLTGHATAPGRRERNEDFVGMVTPDDPALSVKGLIAAVADGVSGSYGGREAAEYAVRGLLADYYATPDTWPVTQALDRVLKATNGWLQQQRVAQPALSDMASTLTAVVLRGRFYHFAHVGDSRLYLFRHGVLTRLTSDHVWDRPEMRHVLTRAIGLDAHLVVDHGMGELRAGDIFLLVTDGVWSALAEYDLSRALSDVALANVDAATAASALVQAALAADASDNASALLLRVTALPDIDLRDALSASTQLPLPPKLKPGQAIDGYRVEQLVHASAATLLYRVTDPGTGRKLALKTLHPDHGGDAHARAAFAHEEWLARRVVARFFPQVIAREQRNYLYYLSTWHDGHTLQRRLDAGEHFVVPDAVTHGMRLVRAIGALHRRSILHRDIKPDNVHLGDDGELRVLDLGMAQSGREDDALHARQAGTPSFLAPEQFSHAPPSPQTDLYGAGVTLYYMLTRRYPYGEIEAFQHPRFGDPVPPSRYRPDIPPWLENVLLKSVARNPADRFETAEEFLLALERGASRPLPPPAARSLVERDPMVVWRMVAVIAVVLDLLLLYVIVAR